MARRTRATTHVTTGHGPSHLVSPEVALSLTAGEAVRYDHRSGAPRRPADTALAHDRLHGRFPEGPPHA